MRASEEARCCTPPAAWREAKNDVEVGVGCLLQGLALRLGEPGTELREITPVGLQRILREPVLEPERVTERVDQPGAL